MATDGPTPPSCDPKVFSSGEVVFITHTIPSNAMEGWVKKIQKLSNKDKSLFQKKNRVDWYFCGGRAVVKALGCIEEVEQAIEELKPEHDRLYKEAMEIL